MIRNHYNAKNFPSALNNTIFSRKRRTLIRESGTQNKTLEQKTGSPLSRNDAENKRLLKQTFNRIFEI